MKQVLIKKGKAIVEKIPARLDHWVYTREGVDGLSEKRAIFSIYSGF